jgi:hypothetical protein
VQELGPETILKVGWGDLDCPARQVIEGIPGLSRDVEYAQKTVYAFHHVVIDIPSDADLIEEFED